MGVGEGLFCLPSPGVPGLSWVEFQRPFFLLHLSFTSAGVDGEKRDYCVSRPFDFSSPWGQGRNCGLHVTHSPRD